MTKKNKERNKTDLNLDHEKYSNVFVSSKCKIKGCFERENERKRKNESKRARTREKERKRQREMGRIKK